VVDGLLDYFSTAYVRPTQKPGNKDKHDHTGHKEQKGDGDKDEKRPM
jgi:hypothetical protein